MRAKLSMRRKTLVSALVVLFVVSIIPVLAGEKEEVDLTVTVLAPPMADAGGPYFCDRYETILLDGSGSYDPDGTIISYSWDFGDGTTGTGVKPSHTYSSTGTLTVKLTVTDDDDLTDSDTTTVKVRKKPSPPPPHRPNKKPKADAGPNQKVWVDKTVQFSGAGSYDKDGSIVSYSWDFGDGKMALGMDVSHVYPKPGRYTVTLTVKDNRGAQDSDKCRVKVSEPPTTVLDDFAERVPGKKKGHVVNALKETSTTVTLDTTDDVTVTILRYEDNPHPDDPMPATALPTYVDVEVSDPDAVVWPIYVEMFYTDEDVVGLDEDSLGIYYWKDGAWKRCSDTGVDTERNVVWAYMTAEEAAGSPILMGSLYAIPVPPLPPIVDNLTIIPAEVELGETVTISVDVKNMDNQSYVYTVSIRIGDFTHHAGAELGPYETVTVSRTYRTETVGTRSVTVDGLTGSYTVNPLPPPPPPPPKPAEFEFSDLTVVPDEVQEGEEVTVGVTVTNIGEEEGVYSVELELDGVVVGVESASLVGGASTAITMMVKGTPAGEHTVQVGALTGGFTVVSVQPEEPEPGFFTPENIVLVLVAVVVGVYMVYYVYIKRLES